MEQGREHPLTATSPRTRRHLSRAIKVVGAIVLLVCVFVLGGFVHFASRVASAEPPNVVDAEGIVALTGGSSRIADAIGLLEKGIGERLLISGVHPKTTGPEIARLVAATGDLFQCCVDLDYDALNTVGNARAATDWAHENGFASLLIVTSAYHMPRSLMEFSRASSDLELVPFPVRSQSLELENWWTDPMVLKVMVSEYAKYIMARLRLRLGPPDGLSQARLSG